MIKLRLHLGQNLTSTILSRLVHFPAFTRLVASTVSAQRTIEQRPRFTKIVKNSLQIPYIVGLGLLGQKGSRASGGPRALFLLNE